MKMRIASLLSVSLFLAGSLFAQEKKETKLPYTATLTINSDSFFGLTPMAQVGIPINDKVSITGYTILWSGIRNGGAGNFGHWTEFGVGLNFTLLEGALNVNPQIGILNGNLLSRGNFGNGNPVFNEGVVPNITMFYDKDKFEAELYGGYYIGTKSQTNPRTTPGGVTLHGSVDPTVENLAATTEGAAALKSINAVPAMFPNKNATLNYTHFWAFPGYRFTEWLSGGLHWEELRVRPSGGNGDTDATVYKWTGLYVKFRVGSGSLRFSAGDSVANVAGPTNAQLIGFASNPATFTTYLNTPQQAGDMNGTYYRVTYSQTF